MGAFDESSDEVVDTKGGAVGRDYVPRNNRIDVDRDVVLGLDSLSGDLGELDLDI